MSQYDVHKHGNQHNLRKELSTHLGDADSRLTTLETRVDDLETRVTELEGKMVRIGGSRWRFQTNNSPPPGSTNFRTNTSDPATTTRIYIHKTSLDGDASVILSLVEPGDVLLYQAEGDSSTAVRMNMGTGIDQTDYWDFACAFDSGGASPISNNTNCVLGFYRALGAGQSAFGPVGQGSP